MHDAAYPLEQLATCAGNGPQATFARQAISLLPRREETLFDASNRGLLMLAQSEDDLSAPRQILRDTFGKHMRFTAPHVRLLYDVGGWQQPIMGFRIVALAALLERVETDLRRRDAAFDDIELSKQRGVIRGHAPLAALLGYPHTLRRLGDGAIDATFWLSHYEPLWSYASETMACYAD